MLPIVLFSFISIDHAVISMNINLFGYARGGANAPPCPNERTPMVSVSFALLLRRMYNCEGTRRRQHADSIWNTSSNYGSRFLNWKT